jgi:acetyl esterase/lipase
MNVSTEPNVIQLWPNGAPGSEGWSQQEQESFAPAPIGIKVVRNVTRPTLTVFLPDPAIATGTTVVVCPGGAFHFLAIEHEGTDVARWLTARGVAAFVLRYRLFQTPTDDEAFIRQMQQSLADRTRFREQRKQLEPLIVADGQQAIKTVRQRATEWNLAPDRIGILGFSAGGAVTAGVALNYDADSRPSFAAPIYSAPREEAPVPADAPPLFIAVADDDAFAASASVPLYLMWNAAGRSAELHIYSKGGHGFGMRQQGLPADHWIDHFGDWLGVQGLLEPLRVK